MVVVVVTGRERMEEEEEGWVGDPRGSVENAPLQGFEANLHNLGRGSVSFSSSLLLLSFLLEEKTRIEGKEEKEK